MPTPTKGPRLGGSPSHERIILANLATQLFEHGRITTTEAKAKRLRPLAEKLITKAKRGDIHSRRQVLTTVRDKSVVHVLFTEIAPTFEGRDGGYLRITKVGPRKGDNAPMAVIELVTETIEQSKSANNKSGSTKAAAKKAAPKAEEAPVVEETVEEVAAEEAPVEAAADEAIETDTAVAAGLVSDVPADDAAEAEGKNYGEGSFRGTEPPAGFDIKGNEDSMKYHTTESQWYAQTVAEVWFNSEEAAQAAGFVNVLDKKD